MLAFHSDAHSLLLPPGHRFPQSKYRLLREHFERTPGLLRMVAAPAAVTVVAHRGLSPRIGVILARRYTPALTIVAECK